MVDRLQVEGLVLLIPTANSLFKENETNYLFIFLDYIAYQFLELPFHRSSLHMPGSIETIQTATASFQRDSFRVDCSLKASQSRIQIQDAREYIQLTFRNHG